MHSVRVGGGAVGPNRPASSGVTLAKEDAMTTTVTNHAASPADEARIDPKGRDGNASIDAEDHPLLDATNLTGTVTGALVGLAMGPVGVVAGAVLGSALGELAGEALEKADREHERHDRELDEQIGVYASDDATRMPGAAPADEGRSWAELERELENCVATKR